MKETAEKSVGSATGLRWLVLDLNSFFASCEQQEHPDLRGRPVAVVPMEAETTCVIAASYPAKAFGIRTGTLVREARTLCPAIIFLPARPKLYVAYHHRILASIEQRIPIEDVMSIDEVACRLDKTQMSCAAAEALGLALKRGIENEVGACLTSSVGIGPNKMLAKLASNMKKPDGLTLLPLASLPEKILPLPVEALPGIGPRMTARLMALGLGDMASLWEADSAALRRAWGGIGGARFHTLLHGGDLTLPSSQRRSISHQHVLAPEVRTLLRAWPFTRQLMIRAAGRLRREGLFCKQVGLEVKALSVDGSFVCSQSVPETQDSLLLLHILAKLWRSLPPLKPLRVGIFLGGLVEEQAHQFDLFEKPQNPKLNQAIDGLNERFGAGAVSFGAGLPELTEKIAFQHVPEG